MKCEKPGTAAAKGCTPHHLSCPSPASPTPNIAPWMRYHPPTLWMPIFCDRMLATNMQTPNTTGPSFQMVGSAPTLPCPIQRTEKPCSKQPHWLPAKNTWACSKSCQRDLLRHIFVQLQRQSAHRLVRQRCGISGDIAAWRLSICQLPGHCTHGNNSGPPNRRSVDQ